MTPPNAELLPEFTSDELIAYVLGDKAGVWLTSNLDELDGMTPAESMAAGQNQKVREVLTRIYFGLPA